MKTNSTQSQEYAEYLIQHQQSLRAKLFQWPYQAHLKSLRLGKTLDVGCGAGRNLKSLSSNSIGIDHYSLMVESCRKRGFTAYTTEEWSQIQNNHVGTFDALLFSHVAEHMSQDQFRSLLNSMLPMLLPHGRVVLICPQEKGYSTDPTHVEFMDYEKIDSIFQSLQLKILNQYSYPFPRSFGKWFAYNEFVSIGMRNNLKK